MLQYCVKSPILILAFNRPEVTQKVFDQISLFKPKKLYISIDGARQGRANEKVLCKQVQDIFEIINWDCEVYRKYNKQNLGCKNAVVSAIDWAFEKEEHLIIIEDDCLPSKSFFKFTDEMLELYKDNKNVMQISGNNFLTNPEIIKDSYYFSKINDIWGWATWKRAWTLLDQEMAGYEEFKSDRKIYRYFPKKLMAVWLEKYLDSAYLQLGYIWSSYWSYTILKNNGLTIAPKKNLVENIGIEINATAGDESKYFKLYSSFKKSELNWPLKHPLQASPNDQADIDRFELIKKTDPAIFFRKRLYSLTRRVTPKPIKKIAKVILQQFYKS